MKKVGIFFLIVILLFTINNLVHSIYSLWQKQEHLVKARQELTKAKKENRRLQDQERIVSNPQFVEEEARNKLLLTKPGEQIVILPEKKVEKKNVRPKQAPANWQQWLALFW